jgi:hypothetical protein
MAAIRGRRPLVGVLTGGSGGIYVAPTANKGRGRGYLVGVLGAGVSAYALTQGEMAIQQRSPAFTQAAEIGLTALTATLAQTAPTFTQAASLLYAPSTARSVRVTYLVLEIPDPATTLTLAQTAPAFTQAMEVDNNSDDRFIYVAQTAPAFTQAAELTYAGANQLLIAQVAPAFTQAVTTSYTPPNFSTTPTYVRVWFVTSDARTWKVS